MGYTHYWYRPAEIPKPAWNGWAGDVRRLIGRFNASSGHTHRVAQEFNNDPWRSPTVTATQVRFNGFGKEFGHETFHVERVFEDVYKQGPKPDGTFFACCKTAQKPYDELVVACLVALKHHFPEVKVSTDGEMEDWRAGLSLCQSVLEYGAEFYVVDRVLEHKALVAVSVS